MRHTFPLLAALLALVLAVTPAGAHHGKGSHAAGATSEEHGAKSAKSDKHGAKSESEEHGSKSEEHGGFAACNWESDPDGCPGNSGWAHWCKDEHEPGPARGRCVADHASDEHDGE